MSTPRSGTPRGSRTSAAAELGIKGSRDVDRVLCQQLRRQINQLLGWKRDDLPITRATVLVRTEISTLVERDHFVHAMSKDGRRVLLLLLNGANYVIDEAYRIIQLPMLFFPLRKDRIVPGATCLVHHWTLVETELIPAKGEENPQFLVFDVLLLNGLSMVNAPLLERLKKVQNDVVAPHTRNIAKLMQQKSAAGGAGSPVSAVAPCTVVTKQLHQSSKLDRIFRKPLTDISSVMFVSLQAYQLGITDRRIVWQPKSTMCFKFDVEWRGSPPKAGFKLMLSRKNTPILYDWISFDDQTYERLSTDAKSASMIAECGYDPQWPTYIPGPSRTSWDAPQNSQLNHPTKGLGWRQGGWYFIRGRKDKLVPDDLLHLEDVKRTIQDNITKEELLLLCATVPGQRTEQQEAAREQILAHARQQKEQQLHQMPNKKRRLGKARGDQGTANEQGVCYDWQNKGDCIRGDNCDWAHCACDTICKCTGENNTYGQRPKRKEDLENENEGEGEGDGSDESAEQQSKGEAGSGDGAAGEQDPPSLPTSEPPPSPPPAAPAPAPTTTVSAGDLEAFTAFAVAANAGTDTAVNGKE